MNRKNNFRVLVVKPEQLPQVCKLDASYSLRKIVDDDIQAVYPFVDPVALICNSNGKIDNLMSNRAIRDDNGNIVDIICGPFVVVGISEDLEFTSLSDTLIEKYYEIFRTPELFVSIAGHIMIYPMNIK